MAPRKPPSTASARPFDSYSASGDLGNLHWTVGFLVVLLARTGRDDEAATTLGIAERHGETLALVADLRDVADALRRTLGEQAFRSLVRDGRQLDTAHAVEYVRERIRPVMSEVSTNNPSPT